MYSRPRVKLIKSPWEAALETGSVDSAFQEFQFPSKVFAAPTPDSYNMMSDPLPPWTPSSNGIGYTKQPEQPKGFSAPNPSYNSASINKLVDNFQKGVSNVDVYKPKVPQAWNTSSQSSQYSKFID